MTKPKCQIEILPFDKGEAEGIYATPEAHVS